MAKIDNSGYILVDFSKVDHNKRTQVIDGFYSDCEKLISNEKFVLLSNVNEVSTTPIPSIVLFKNSIYNVITFEYVYTISAGDVVVVTKNEGGITVDVIDDSIIALNKTWSSSKINEMLPDNAGQITYDNTVSHLQSNRVQSAIDELVTIVNGVDSRVTITETDISNIKNQLITIGNEVSALHDSNNIIYEGSTTVNEAITALDNNKQDILTAGNNISISLNSVISAVDTKYTAGNNVSISSENVISATDTTYGAGAGLSLTGNVFSVDPSTAGIEASDVEYSSGVSVADVLDIQTNTSVLSASFTANSSNAANTVLSDDINLVKGLYLISIALPVMSVSTFSVQVVGTNITKYGSLYPKMREQTTMTFLLSVNGATDTICIKSAESTAVSFTYLDRGGLFAYRLA